ncbi:MAG TPA: hypothetical protein VJJ47_00200 [Candidatus Paceibacterota bacterium]
MNNKNSTKMWACVAVAFGLASALFFLTSRPTSASGQPNPATSDAAFPAPAETVVTKDATELQLNAMGLTKETGFTLAVTRASSTEQGGAK